MKWFGHINFVWLMYKNHEERRYSVSESEFLVYIDHSEVRERKFDELKAAIEELTELVKTKEPWIAAYNVFFSESGNRMIVVHIHPESASLEFHM